MAYACKIPQHIIVQMAMGTVSKGAREGAVYPGAAPITLIDGERLLDLLVEHGIGVKKRPVEIWEVDETFFKENYPGIEVNDEQLEK